MLSEKPDTVIDSAMFLGGQGIYFWMRGDEILYVGVSRRIFKRIFAHQIIGYEESFQEGDVVKIWMFPNISYYDLELIERSFIKMHSPRYNQAHNPDERVPRKRPRRILGPSVSGEVLFDPSNPNRKRRTVKRQNNV